MQNVAHAPSVAPRGDIRTPAMHCVARGYADLTWGR